MNIKTCQFIEASEVFADCPLAWDIFLNSEPNCSWGDNNRTMVTADLVVDTLEDAEPNEKESEQINTVLDRLEDVDIDTYIDLEN